MSIFRVGSNKSSVNNFPSVRPTLDLDFANSKTLDPRITFTRASGGSYVGADGYIKFAGVNEARFDHNPVTGESLGLLIEEARTNLLIGSETFVSGWGGSIGSIANTDTILNPYGVLGTVYYITVSEWTKDFNANGLSTLALSFFAKRRFGGLNRDYNNIEIFQQAVGGGSLGSYNFRFDGNNPNFGQFQNIRTERYQNDWYRFSCTLVARPDYNGGVFGTDARVDLEGSVADNYFWGIQVESGAFATSYIPTIGSTRTRAADNASITGKNFSEWYRQDEGSFYSQFKTQLNITNNIWSINNYPNTTFGTLQNYFRLLTLSNNIHTQYNVAGTNLYPTFPLTTNTSQKVTQSYNINPSPITSTLNGTIGTGSGNIYATSPGFNQLEFGKNTDARTTIGQYTISRLTYYPKRLTNAQLQALTK